MTMLPPELINGLGEDEEVRAQVKSLVLESITMAHELLTSASPMIRQQIMKSVLPHAVRAATAEKDRAELQKLQVMMHDLMKEVREGTVESTTPHLEVVYSDEEPDGGTTPTELGAGRLPR